mgnify:CR=1 FL=1
MWYEHLFQELENLRNNDNAIPMAAYMKNRFPFLGIKKPVRAALTKPYLKASKQQAVDWDFVENCWNKDYREAQYIAVDYLLLHQQRLSEDDLTRIAEYITRKSWWDTVDGLDEVVGTLASKYPHLKHTVLTWSKNGNLWLRRVSINFQQKYKENTDTQLLEEVIINNLGSGEFFINKAIGWSLREYSKTNPDWVRAFLARHQSSLSSLSLREAGKYI